MAGIALKGGGVEDHPKLCIFRKYMSFDFLKKWSVVYEINFKSPVLFMIIYYINVEKPEIEKVITCYRILVEWKPTIECVFKIVEQWRARAKMLYI